jgi:hypothetical protein
MKIIITTMQELEVDAGKLKQIKNMDVDDIFKNGKCTKSKSNFSIDKDDDVEFDRDIEKKVLSVLWGEKKA